MPPHKKLASAHPEFLYFFIFTVTTCGHVMHAKCYQTMFDNLVKQHRQELGIRHNFNINQQVK